MQAVIPQDSYEGDWKSVDLQSLQWQQELQHVAPFPELL